MEKYKSYQDCATGNLLKPTNITLEEVIEHILSENFELCLFVKFSDLGIGEVSGTHPPASSRLCYQVTKRRRTEERGLGQQDYTRRIISSPYNCRRLWEEQTRT